MLELLRLFVLAKRGDRRASAGRSLRDLLAERVKAPATTVAAPRPGQPPAPFAVRRAIAAEPVAVAPAPVAPAAVAPVAMPLRRAAAAVPASPEAGLVTGLFASPASLVAAFIVAEVLAKPVALRDR